MDVVSSAAADDVAPSLFTQHRKELRQTLSHAGAEPLIGSQARPRKITAPAAPPATIPSTPGISEAQYRALTPAMVEKKTRITPGRNTLKGVAPYMAGAAID
jgi:hypothetical protein